MRTIVDIPEDQIKALDLLGKKHDLSRAELVRRAVGQYLEAEQASKKSDLDKYFGILKGSDLFEGMDGLAWQKKMRAEWADRDAAIDRRLAENTGLNDKKQSDYEGK
ncbi:MAG: CopG family transcriptional regulator [Alphaproteobacteria bacterium]